MLFCIQNYVSSSYCIAINVVFLYRTLQMFNKEMKDALILKVLSLDAAAHARLSQTGVADFSQRFASPQSWRRASGSASSASSIKTTR